MTGKKNCSFHRLFKSPFFLHIPAKKLFNKGFLDDEASSSVLLSGFNYLAKKCVVDNGASSKTIRADLRHTLKSPFS